MVSIHSPAVRQVGRTDSHCPKCLRSVRQGSESCPKCGLIFALWEKGIVPVPGTGSEIDGEDLRAQALWQRVEKTPEDEASHEAFLKYCHESRCLDLAAARYQAFLFHHPQSQQARTYRDRIILLAQFDAHPVRKPRYTPRRFLRVKMVLVLGFAAFLWGLVMAQLLLRS